MWQDLIDILDKLGAIYEKVAILGERKRNALVGIDMQGLSAILDEEQLIIAKIQKLEKQRVELLRDLSKSNKDVKEDTKATEFYRLAPTPEVQSQLLQAHERLSKNVDRAITIRDNNKILAQCALDAVQGQLNKLGGATVEPTYSGKGAGIVTHKKNFDFKA